MSAAGESPKVAADLGDGGPAFPVSQQGAWVGTPWGMTLRDWFAGQALVGIILSDSRSDGLHRSTSSRSEWCYAQADAMLAERVK